jgi:serine/threonine protein kinase
LYVRNHPFSEKTTIQIGLKVFDLLEVIHRAGYLYLDVKLNNIVVG